jgi:beta-glucosidase/6-phospho-beta-glucosidase/beta-galactosidase
MTSKFPKNLLWDMTSSNYQIEGVRNLDGGGENIWGNFNKSSGKVANVDNGFIECDH